MSFPFAWPTLPPLATVFRFASVTENSIGKVDRFDAPETFVWSTVIALRLLHAVLYQGGVVPPPPPVAIVYGPELIELSGLPARYAMALTVVVALTVIAPLYTVPAVSLGALPSVVYRIVAPAVVVVMVTVCAVL